MMSRRLLLTYLVFVSPCLLLCSDVLAQSPSTLYTWDGTGNIQQWFKSFGPNTVLLDNAVAGSLRVIEIGGAGASVAFSDDFNRVRESSTASGGLDLTGLDFLEFDIGHSGASNINVQFYVQATPSSTFVALGPDLSVAPGIATYQVPLSGLSAAQLVYDRTLGVNVRDHAAVGDVVWTLQEVRSGGTPLAVRDLITHDVGTPEGGLQGAIVNFDNASILGNNGGQNQTGLSHNAGGTGSLQWTDVAGGNGGAISWGNGSAWNGNTFNNRTTDVSNYDTVMIRISATDALGGGGSVNVQSFFQTGPGFAFASPGTLALPIDGQFHELRFPLAGLVDLNVVDLTGINLGSHANELVMNVDLVRFVPEPTSVALLGIAAVGCLGMIRRGRRTA